MRRHGALVRSCCVVLMHVLILSRLSAQDSPHGRLKIPCEDCHTSASWNVLAKPMKFDHRETAFPLVGAHQQVQCRQCHATLAFSGTETKCGECHKDVHRGELGANCERCHSTQTWLVPDMPQRHAQTRFPLVGRHLTAPCQACHVNQQQDEYVAIPTDCYGCHRVQYDATTVPAHRAVGFGTNCEECHAMTAMRFEGTFDHNTTGFPLLGAHAAQPCASCHAANNFQKASAQCMSCHQKDFAGAQSPPHGGFPSDCTTCHTMNAWQPASFDHGKTSFPLVGAHLSVPCASCHKNNVFAGTPTQCASCHQQDFTNATNPPHAGFPTDCTTCHTMNAWQPASFDHSRTTFPLTGAHTAVACASCHANNQFAGTPTQCYSCHQQQFTGASNPSHAGFPTDCTTCHTTTAWQPSTFDHSKTAFPLTGAHAAVACISCHTTSQFASTPTQCYSCHQQDFTAANAPPHAGFSTDCTTCHTTAAWQPATFDHSKTAFPLTGAHLAVACAQCHVNNVYAGLPSQCVSCHQTDYNTTTNPNHASAGFPTTCQTCHTTTAWTGATFNHTWFPTNHGNAGGVCATCHTNPSDYSVFQCTVCHTQSQTDSNHRNIQGYVYNSTNCYQCHPRGSGG